MVSKNDLQPTSKRIKINIRPAIDKLPKAIINKIFTYTDIETMISKVFLVSRYWNQLFSLPESWSTLNINNIEEYNFILKHVRNFNLVKSITLYEIHGIELPEFKNLTRFKFICKDLKPVSLKLPPVKYLHMRKCIIYNFIFPIDIERIVLNNCNVDDISIDSIESIHNTRKSLNSIKASWKLFRMMNEHWKFDSKLEIEQLFLNGGFIGNMDDEFNNIFNCISISSISELDITIPHRVCNELSNLKSFDQLKYLSLRINGHYANNGPFEISVPSIPTLESLEIRSKGVILAMNIDFYYPNLISFTTDLLIEKITRIHAPKLCDLNLMMNNLPDGFDSKLNNVKRLYILNINDKDIKILSEWKSIESIELFISHDINDCRILEYMPWLTSIHLECVNTKADQIPSIAINAKNLQYLYVDSIEDGPIQIGKLLITSA